LALTAEGRELGVAARILRHPREPPPISHVQCVAEDVGATDDRSLVDAAPAAAPGGADPPRNLLSGGRAYRGLTEG